MSALKPKLLIVDDEESICELLFEAMTGFGYDCATAASAEEALDLIGRQRFDLALLDIRLPGQTGMALLRKIVSDHPEIAPVMLTAVNEVGVAVESMKVGALDYITKPFELNKVNEALQAALTRKALQAGNTGESLDPDIAAIEAIARGVETHEDILDIHSERVLLQTIEIARRMEIPEDKVQQWANLRYGQHSDVIKQVTEGMFKLAQNIDEGPL